MFSVFGYILDSTIEIIGTKNVNLMFHKNKNGVSLFVDNKKKLT